MTSVAMVVILVAVIGVVPIMTGFVMGMLPVSAMLVIIGVFLVVMAAAALYAFMFFTTAAIAVALAVYRVLGFAGGFLFGIVFPVFGVHHAIAAKN